VPVSGTQTGPVLRLCSQRCFEGTAAAEIKDALAAKSYLEEVAPLLELQYCG